MRTGIATYFWSLVVTAAAVGLRWAFDPWLGDYAPLVTLFGAVAFSVWLGGYGPAIVSMVLGYVAVDWLFAQPRGQLEWQAREFIAVAGYVVSCALIIGLGQRMRASEARFRDVVAEREVAQGKAEALSHEHARQRQFLETLLDNATVCVAVMAGRDLRYTFVNRTYQALRPDVPMLGRLYREVFPEAVSSGAEAMHQAVLDTGAPREEYGFALPIPGKPDAAWDQRIVPIPSTTADEPMILVMQWDVTSRERAARELSESRERFHRLADAMPQLVWTADPNGRVDYYNEKRRAYGGLQTDVNDWQLIVHPEDLANTVARWERANQEGVPFEIEHRVALADGSFRWHLSRALPARDEAGRIVKWFGTATDIQSLKEVEAELARTSGSLAREQERLELALQAAQMGVYEWRVGADDLWWSPEMYAIYGVNRELFTPTSNAFSALIHPHDREELWRKTQHCLETGEVFSHEYRIIRASGEVRWVHNRSNVKYSSAGRPERITGVGFDITERKAAEQALLEADQRKNEFIATLAHELRNPLAPIRNAVQLLKYGEAAAANWMWTRDVIDRQVSHMARLLDDLLDISRISRNKIELQLGRVSLASVLEVALETSRPLIERARHELTVQTTHETVWLQTDAVRLAQVMSNLLNNAAKYTEPGGRIALSAEVNGGEVVVRVRDNGIGIEPSMLSRVFEMFAQAKPALERSQGGLGIGLSLSRGLIEAMGGRIEARSDGVGQGSEFIVYVPQASIASGEHAAAPHQLAPAARHSARILIADDVRDSADSLAILLETMGYEVRTAYDGREAVAAAAQFAPDVVLLDLGMPLLNGYDACKQIRAAAADRSPYLVALTGWGHEEERRKTSEAGFDNHLVKPVDLAQLNAVLESLLGGRIRTVGDG